MLEDEPAAAKRAQHPDGVEAAAAAIPGAIGLSGSTVSRAFIQASATQLRELQERDLSEEDVVVLVLDGKTFADATMVIALGVTMTGEKRFLGFVETDTENEKVLTPFLRSLGERGLDCSQGLLVILDGGKGLRSAARKAFRDRVALGPRSCGAQKSWHTRLCETLRDGCGTNPRFYWGARKLSTAPSDQKF